MVLCGIAGRGHSMVLCGIAKRSHGMVLCGIAGKGHAKTNYHLIPGPYHPLQKTSPILYLNLPTIHYEHDSHVGLK